MFIPAYLKLEQANTSSGQNIAQTLGTCGEKFSWLCVQFHYFKLKPIDQAVTCWAYWDIEHFVCVFWKMCSINKILTQWVRECPICILMFGERRRFWWNMDAQTEEKSVKIYSLTFRMRVSSDLSKDDKIKTWQDISKQDVN